MPIWLSYLVTAIGLAVSFGNLCVMVYALSGFLKKPNKTQNERLDMHDEQLRLVSGRIDAVEGRLDDTQLHFKVIDEGTAVTQSALVAIMDALVPMVPDERSKGELKNKRDDLFSYLIDK